MKINGELMKFATSYTLTDEQTVVVLTADIKKVHEKLINIGVPHVQEIALLECRVSPDELRTIMDWKDVTYIIKR